jgi:hypothetical protein
MAKPNYFDQFDEEKGNFFDQFDEGGQTQSAAQRPEIRDPRQGPRTASERRAATAERRQVSYQAAQASREQADAERRARVDPVRQQADIAAGQAGQQYRQTAPFPDRTDRMMTQDFARQQVYDQAGVVSPENAFTGRSLNAMALGAPGLMSEDVRNWMGQASEDQPVASMMGDIGGFLAPGVAIGSAGVRAGERALRPVINRVMPTGTSAAARGTRLGGRVVAGAGIGSAESGLYQGTVGESVAAAEEGRAPTLASMGRGAIEGATDPVALLALPALTGANRLLTYLRSGGVTSTPADVSRRIDEQTGRLSDVRTGIGQTLDLEAAGSDVRPQAFDRIIRELESANLSREDIGRLLESVQDRFAGLTDAQVGRLTFGQALAEATARDRPQALQAVLSTLRERRLSPRRGDESAGIISGTTQELRRSQADFLSDSIGRNIGDTTLPEVSQQIEDARRQISAEYNRVLAAADPERPAARGIAMIVQLDPSRNVLGRRATNAGFSNVESYIAARPDEAGHWLRSHLAKASRTAQGRERVDLENTVRQLDELLETNEGYRQARQRWGHEAGLEEAQDWARNFANVARDEGAVADLLGELQRMPEAQRNVAMSSLRNEILKSIRGGPEDASIRISKWTTAGALDALEQLGEGGARVADDLRFLRREQQWLGGIDPETNSRTAANLIAAQAAQEAGNTALSNLARGGRSNALAFDVGLSTITETALPIMTTQRALGSVGDFIFRPRTETLQDVARLYMGRRGNIPGTPGQPDFTPAFERGGPGGAPPSNAFNPPVASSAPQAVNAFSPSAAPVEEAQNVFSPGYFNRQSMRSQEPVMGERTQQLRADWEPVTAALTGASNTSRAAMSVAEQALQSRTPEAIEAAQQAKAMLRSEIEGIMSARAGMATPEDQRLSDALRALSEQTGDPVLLGTQIDVARTNLNRVLESLGQGREGNLIPVPTRPPVRRTFSPEEEGRTIPDEAGRPSRTRYAETPDDTQMGLSGNATLTNAFAGGAIGAVAPAESAEERARNVALGVGLGAGASRLGLRAGGARGMGVGGERQGFSQSVLAGKTDVSDAVKNARKMAEDVTGYRVGSQQGFETETSLLDYARIEHDDGFITASPAVSKTFADWLSVNRKPVGNNYEITARDFKEIDPDAYDLYFGGLSENMGSSLGPDDIQISVPKSAVDERLLADEDLEFSQVFMDPSALSRINEGKTAQITSLDTALTHPNHHVRAETFRSLLDKAGVRYDTASRATGVNSEYIVLRAPDEANVGDIKIRFSDHANQSRLHERADYNFVGTDYSTDDYLKVIDDWLSKVRQAEQRNASPSASGMSLAAPFAVGGAALGAGAEQRNAFAQ